MTRGYWNTRYLKGANPDALRDDLMGRVRSNPARTARELDNRVNERWFMGEPYWYRQAGSTRIVGMSPQRRKSFIYPNILRDIVRTVCGVMYYEPDVDAFPSTSDPGDIVRAEMDQHIARYLLSDGDGAGAFRSVTEMQNLYGEGYIKVLWDPDAGSRRPLVNTELCPVCSNQEVQQAQSGMLYRGGGAGSGVIYTDAGVQACPHCQAQGVDDAQGVAGPLGHITRYLGTKAEGNVAFQSVHPDDVFADPDATRWSEVEEVIHRIRMSPERAWSRYGRALGLNQDYFENLPRTSTDPFPSRYERRPGDSRYLTVMEHYRRPNEKHPEGLFSVSIGSECILADSLPYLHDRHWCPLFRFTMYESEGVFFPVSTADLALPLVLAYAEQFSAGHFRAKESARMRLLVPDSTNIRHNDDTGHIHYKDKPGAKTPEPITLGPPPSDMVDMRETLMMLMDRVSGATDVLRGMTGGAESGVAMSFMEERSLGPLRPVMSSTARGFDDVIKYAVEVAKLEFEDGRVLRMVGQNGAPQVREFRVSDCGDGADVRLRAVKNAGRSRAAQMAEVNEAAKIGMLDPAKYEKLAQFGELDGVWSEKQPHRNMAVNEGQTLEQTGNIQQPLPTEDHECHIAEHTKQLNAIKLRDPGSPLIQILLQHVDVHEQMAAYNQVKAQLHQQMAMQSFGQANAANPDFQPPETVEAAEQTQGAAASNGLSSPSAGGAAASEPFLSEGSPLGEAPNYQTAGTRVAVGGM